MLVAFGLIAVVVCVAALQGCTAVRPRESFGAVERLVGDRTSQRVHWRTGGEDDQAVDALIASTLEQPLDANAAAQIALLNNPALQAVYEDLGIAQADLVQAGLLSNPTLSASMLFPIASGADVRPNLGAVQPFLDLFLIPLRKKVAKSSLAAAQHRVAEQVIAHAARTKATFYRAAADKQAAAMLREIAAAMHQSLEDLRQLREAGSVTYLDLRNMEALHEQTRMDLARAEAQVRISREQLTALMGLTGDATHWEMEVQARGRRDFQGLPADDFEGLTMETIEELAVERSLALASLRARIDAAGADLGIAEASALLPAANPGVSAQRRSGEWFVGPSLSLPLPIFDQGQAVTAAAEARLRQQMILHEAAAANVRMAARTAAERVRIARRTVEHYRDVLLPLRAEIYEDSLLQFHALRISMLDLIAVRQQQLATKRQAIEAAYEYWLARSTLEQVLAGSAPAAVAEQ